MNPRRAGITRTAKRTSLIFAAACGLNVLFGAVAAPAQPATRVRGQFGDWQKICTTPVGSKREICAIVQDVISESNPNVGLSVHFQKVRSGGKILRVVAPLGIILPPGLGLQIDDAKVGHAPFVRCGVIGCLARVTLTKDLITKFSSGKTAIFIVFQTKEAGIGIPVSLAGFSPGLASLDQ